MSEAADFQPAELELQRAFLQRLARQLVRGEAAAEDLVQETFLLALQHPPASATVLRSWLTRVARHLAINRGRGEQRALARERRAARSEALPSHDEALASLELQERLIAAVKSLAEPYRTTLWLRFHEGLAPGAIAEQQETTKKTIESRLTRGLAQLRTELDRQAGGDRTQWLGGMLVLARGPVAPWVASLIGVGVMQKFVLVAVTLVVFGLAWRLVPRSEKAPTGEVASHVAAVPETAPLPATPTEAQRAALALEQIPASADAAASGLLVHVRWADGTPASDVGLILHPEDDPRGERAVLRLTTDAGGLAHVASIAAGRVRVEADRGGERTFVVAAQGRTEVVFDLAAGVDVEGTVLDTAGAPLAGAEVLLVSAALDWLGTRVVTHASANGAYRMRDVQTEFSVSARASGFAPALLRRLAGRAGTVRIDFVLVQKGAGLRGIVRDPEGRPVARALVAVGAPIGHWEEDSEHLGQYLEARGLCVEETDEQGRFFAAGARTGFGLSVAVQAADYPIAVVNVTAEAGATAFVEIVLTPPAVLTGVVRTSTGAPAAGVKLTTSSCEGARAHEVPFGLPRATSDGAGRYRIELLPRTSVLRLDPQPGDAGRPTVVPLALRPGETSRDLVLADDDSIRGRVEVPPGTPLDGWFVRALELNGISGRLKYAPSGAPFVMTENVGADGRFVLGGGGLPPYRIELYAARDRLVLRRDDVGPGPELVLVVEALGSIQGEFADAAGLLPAGERPDIRVALGEIVTQAPIGDEAGRFAFELLRAGRYYLTIEHAERPLFATWVDLAPGKHVDLGRITSAPLGSLVLSLDPWPSTGLSGTVLDAGLGQVAVLELVDGRLGVPALPPGDWLLDLQAEDTGRICAPFTIRAGERTELRLATAPGVERSLSLRLDGSEWNTLGVELRDPRGRLVFARRILRSYSPTAGRGPNLLVTLPVGTFTLEAETDTGLALRTSFDVPALVPQESALEFELR